jgi:hypothetical protein
MAENLIRLYIVYVHPILRALGRATILFALGTALVSPVAAKELTSDDGIFIDMPSGFSPGEGDGETRFSYFSPDEEMELDILIQEPGRLASAEEMAAKMLENLDSKGQTSSFVYEGRRAVIAELSFTLDGSSRRGYGLFISGSPSLPGRPASGRGYALLAHARASQFDSVADFIMSCLDAFSIDRAARRSPGPVSQFVLPWPAPRPGRKTAMFPGSGIELPWSSEEARQELLTAQREYRILTTFLEDRTLWIDAWARFYRMVYRESAARLDSFTEAFAHTLPANDPTESARRVLAWVQGFVFERDLSGLDFVPPLVAAFERRGDCDSRAMVMAILLERLGVDCVLMLSREYSHAMLAVDVPGGGQRFPFKGREYLVAETTARVGLGMIDSSQADFSKWLGVDLGE